MRRLLLVLCLLPVSVFALDWETTKLTATVAATDSFYLAVFPFKNRSKKTVTIQSVTPSCGCTTPSLNKQTYAAGESGEVTAVLDFEGQSGLLEKSLTVATDEPSANITELRFAVTVPPLLTCTPDKLHWTRGESPETKKVKIEALKGLPALKLNVKAVRGFTVEMVALENDGESYELRITPADTQEKREALFVVRTEYPEGADRAFEIFANVD